MSEHDDKEHQYCPGSDQTPIAPTYAYGICRGCGQRRGTRLDGKIPKHPRKLPA